MGQKVLFSKGIMGIPGSKDPPVFAQHQPN
jgi:hypothetical protein